MESNPEATETINQEITLKQLITKLTNGYRYLKTQWMVIFVFAALGGFLGFLYSYLTKPVYTATTAFVLEDGEGGGGMSQYLGIASMVGIDIGGSTGGIFHGDNIVELYKSGSMIRKALLTEMPGTSKLLVDQYIDIYELRKKWNENSELKKIFFKNEKSFTRLQDSVLNSIVSNIKEKYLFVQKPDKKLSIIHVDVKSCDEAFSKIFNDVLVKTVNKFYIDTKTERSLKTVYLLQQKLDSVRSVMTGAIYRSVSIADATPNLNPTRQTQRIAPMQKSQFTAEANKAIYSELNKNLELSKMTLSKETPLVQIIDAPILPLPKEEVGKVKGIIIGAILSLTLTIMYLLGRKAYKQIITS